MPEQDNERYRMQTVGKLRAYKQLLETNRELALELYNEGGKHPKDIEVARVYEQQVAMLETLFPECAA